MSLMKSENIGALAAALAKAQAEVMAAHKDSKNPFFNSKYADLSSVWDACREPLSKNSLSVVQLPALDGDRVSVTTLLLHGSGEWIAGVLSVKPAKPDAQGIGAATTYLRRFGLQSMVGVCPMDDDGNEASGKPAPPPKPKRPALPTPAANPTDEEMAAIDAGFTSLKEAKDMRAHAFRTAIKSGWSETGIKEAIAKEFQGRGFRGLTKDELREALMLCERKPA